MKTPRSQRVYAHDLRPSALHTVQEKPRNSAAKGKRVDLVRYLDGALYDRMHARSQLSDRQHGVAERLARMWVAAGLDPRTNATFGLVRDEVVEEFDPPPGEKNSSGDPDQPTGRDRYRRLMRSVPTVHALRIEAMLCDQHPGVQWLEALQTALDYVGDVWKVERE